MQRYVSDLVRGLLFSAGLAIAAPAATLTGTVADPSGLPVAGAQVSVVDRVGVEAQTPVGINGWFELKTPPGLAADAKVVITAAGFRTVEIMAGAINAPLAVRMQLAPVVDSVRVAGSALDVPVSQQGGSVSLIPRDEIETSDQPLALDLLRTLPGMVFSQTGNTGAIAQMYARGGDTDYNLVEIDGVPVNAFGGTFDFSHIPTEELDHVEVATGAQSSVYGEYANSSVVNFVTRDPNAAANVDVVAEGGSYAEHRFGISGGGQVAGFGVAASASRMDDSGPVPNSDYHNEGALLNVTRRMGRQTFNLHADFDTWNVGEPGPYGSDPLGDYTGYDLISRSRNNFGDYLAHYEIEAGERLREDVFASFFLDNAGYTSPYGFSFNKDLRGQAEERTIISVTRHYTMAVGTSETLEEVRNTYVTDEASDTFPVRRNDTAVYWENRFQLGGHFFFDAGVRGEFVRTGAIATDGVSRPFFPAQTVDAADPKLSAAYVHGGARLHASFGTGLRPPDVYDIAFTDNPALKPERTRSFEAGIEQKFAGDKLVLDGTYFYNRYYDLIVILGGSLSVLSHYESDNIANSEAQGAEFRAQYRPARWLFVTGSYTHLDTQILALNGSSDLAPAPFAVGQELLRRPPDSGSGTASFTRGRVSGHVTGYFRGSDLDVEPTYGATAGLYRCPGFVNLGISLNVRLGHGLTAYGNLRNALDRHYEDAFGYPALRLNFVSGVRWTFAK
jgi:outer membrane cobalamin receptor